MLDTTGLHFVLVTLLGMPSGIAAEPLVLDLWPDGVPLSGQKADSPRSETNKNGILRITNVTRPQMTVYRPNDPNGAAYLFAPAVATKF